MNRHSHVTSEKPKSGGSSALKWILIGLAVVFALVVDHYRPGWGRPVVLTLTVFGALIGVARELWSFPFWITIAVSLVLHVALVLHFRGLVNQVPMVAIFLFAVAEVVVIASVMTCVVTGKQRG